jgi:hypothetical protein
LLIFHRRVQKDNDERKSNLRVFVNVDYPLVT